MFADSTMHKESQVNAHIYIESMHMSDSRYSRMISVLDEIIMTACIGSGDVTEKKLEELLCNSLAQTQAENTHMLTISYPAYVKHKLDHNRICTAIANICFKPSSSLCTIRDLHTLRELLHGHINEHDQVFERYLLAEDIYRDRTYRAVGQ